MDEENTTVGSNLNVSHLAPSKVGAKIICNSKLSEIDNRRLVFEINVLDGDKLIGKGTHERFIVNKEKFLSKLK